MHRAVIAILLVLGVAAVAFGAYAFIACLRMGFDAALTPVSLTILAALAIVEVQARVGA